MATSASVRWWTAEASAGMERPGLTINESTRITCKSGKHKSYAAISMVRIEAGSLDVDDANSGSVGHDTVHLPDQSGVLVILGILCSRQNPKNRIGHISIFWPFQLSLAFRVLMESEYSLSV